MTKSEENSKKKIRFLFWDIAVKNFKNIFRDKKQILVLFLVPICYFIIYGAITSSIEANVSQKVYNIGWIDNDSSESHDPYKNLDYLYTRINDLSVIDLRNCTSNNTATDLLNKKEIDAYILFSEGYELYINGTGTKPDTPVMIYFHPTSESVARNVISTLIKESIDAIINFNPSSIDVYIEDQSLNGEYINSMTSTTPSLLILGAFMLLTSSVISITQEKKEGILNRLETSEMQPKDVILGNNIVNTVFVIIVILIGFLLCKLFGFSLVSTDLISVIIGSLLIVLAFSFFLNGFAMLVATTVKKPEATPGAVFGFLIPIGFASGLFFSLELLSPGMVPYVGWLPPRISLLLFKEILINNTSIINLNFIIPLFWLFVEGLLLNYLAMKLYRKFAQAQI